MKKRKNCLIIVFCVSTVIVIVSYREILCIHTQYDTINETNQLQEKLLLEIKKLGPSIHPEFSYYENEKKYLHILIDESDHLKLKEILRLISLLPQPPLEIVVRQACVDDCIVSLLQKIDPKRLRFWDCSFDENLMTLYKENSKLEWLTINHCKFTSHFLNLFNGSHLSEIRLTNIEIGSPEIDAINKLKDLRSLSVNYSRFEENVLPKLTVDTLEEIDLSNTNISSNEISFLHRFDNIKRISFAECDLDSADFSWLDSDVKKICLNISQAVINDSQVKLLDSLKERKKISIIGKPRVVATVPAQVIDSEPKTEEQTSKPEKK